VRIYNTGKKIRLIESNATCRQIKKFTGKGTLRQVFICPKPPPLLGFCLGWPSNFVGSEFGQIQSVKLLQNMVRVLSVTFSEIKKIYQKSDFVRENEAHPRPKYF
jgi:hypothetical protein